MIPFEGDKKMAVLNRASVKKVKQALKEADIKVRFRELKSPASGVKTAAKALKVDPGAVVQSNLYFIGEQPILVLLAGDHVCTADALPRCLNLDDTGEVRRALKYEDKKYTGYERGGIAPFMVDLPTVIDVSLKRFDTLYVPGGDPYAVFTLDCRALNRLTGGIISYAIATPSE
jgi:prolyl-tRNA editing enzyme YbaK/EbsC (Cys-tRNA(Pro) deacylase)